MVSFVCFEKILTFFADYSILNNSKVYKTKPSAHPQNAQKEESIFMAIISCPECGKQISDRAFSCPNCGCPINAVPVENTQESVSKEVEKLLVLARRAREGSDGKNAKKYRLYHQKLFYIIYKKCKKGIAILLLVVYNSPWGNVVRQNTVLPLNSHDWKLL